MLGTRAALFEKYNDRLWAVGLRTRGDCVWIGEALRPFVAGTTCAAERRYVRHYRAPVNIEELEADLPNGLHDALLRTFSSDVPERRAEFILDVWLGDLGSSVTAERERYRAARLELLGLAYLVVDDHDPRYPVGDGSHVRIDACGADDDPQRSRQVPPGGFAGRFFVTEWNAFIHFSARDARLLWIGAS